MNYYELLEEVGRLTLPQKRELNKALVSSIKLHQKLNHLQAARAFSVGEEVVIEANGKWYGFRGTIIKVGRTGKLHLVGTQLGRGLKAPATTVRKIANT